MTEMLQHTEKMWQVFKHNHIRATECRHNSIIHAGKIPFDMCYDCKCGGGGDKKSE